MNTPVDPETRDRLQKECDAHLASCQTVQLATVDAQGEPDASYAPCLQRQGRFYLFVSELAVHTRNLLHHPSASLLFIEDEQRSRNLFARKRLILRCAAEELSRDGVEADSILQGFRDTFGDTVELLESLPDFHLFELRPESGSFVKGFGQAWLVDAGLRLVAQIKSR